MSAAASSGEAPDPRVAEVPAHAEASVERLGRWFLEQESDPTARTRLIHDWMATHVAYDVPALELEASDLWARSDAATVLARRLGVCSGYGHLFQALGTAAGLEVVSIPGTARTRTGEVVTCGMPFGWRVPGSSST